jgi:hypothetical protein
MSFDILEGERREGTNRLTVCLNPPIDMYLHHATKLAIILPKQPKHLLKHYIQTYWTPEWTKPGSWGSAFDFYNPGLFDLYAYEKQVFSGQTIKVARSDLLDLLMHWIDLGFYPEMVSDETLLPGTLMHGREGPFYHPAFYFGYDRHRQIFHLLNYDKTRNIRAIEVPFEAVISSLYFNRSSGRLNDHIHLNATLWKPNVGYLATNYTDELVAGNIRLELGDYLENKPSRWIGGIVFPQERIWGQKIVYSNLMALAKEEYPGNSRLQSVSGFYQHKKVMHDRLQYLSELGLIDGKTVDAYAVVCQQAMLYRTMYMKYTMRKQPSQLPRLLELLTDIETAETRVLTDVLRHLESR